MIWFTADLHLGHSNILKHCKRPFATIEDMDTAIIRTINDTVSKDDVLWILGDFSWKPATYGFYRKQLAVRQIHVIQGNHDHPSLKKFVSSVESVVYRRFGTQRFFLSHYPHHSWRGSNHGSIHLYGHSHGTLEEKLNQQYPSRKSMDVGIDVEWRPFSLDEILGRFK